eukprot:CAMPEP_0184503286 /NCGR_PEP_ID=MMETSP0113_2-20130426/51803_1 /TAXON_ID=91329 /ORGANISM="Norrisiella sphaerica, Strain BC52" /LENGTH=182 /DNA_ID=CAMNT_0026892757 /DNA_START=235 /DNA_END=783 /DNA_ORIENTATION=+
MAAGSNKVLRSQLQDRVVKMRGGMAGDLLPAHLFDIMNDLMIGGKPETMCKPGSKCGVQTKSKASPPPAALRAPTPAANKCASDVIDAGSSIVIACDLPGVDKENVKVTIKDSILTVTGKRERPSDLQGVVLDERWFGNFSRAFRVPDSIDTTAINATQSDGVLVIRMAKKPEKKPITIPIS